MVSFAMSGKECLSQIPLPPWDIFTALLLGDATFKQSCQDGLSCPKLRQTERVGGPPRRCGWPPSLWRKVPGETWTKAPSQWQGETRSSRNSKQCWESSERGEAADTFFSLVSSHTSVKSQIRPWRKGWDSSLHSGTSPYHTSTGLGPWCLFVLKFLDCQGDARRHKSFLYVISFFHAIS